MSLTVARAYNITEMINKRTTRCFKQGDTPNMRHTW